MGNKLQHNQGIVNGHKPFTSKRELVEALMLAITSRAPLHNIIASVRVSNAHLWADGNTTTESR